MEIRLENLKFTEEGLIPAIVQDQQTLRVLMLAYMNEESLVKTLDTGLTHFWSRSRKRLWQKGETSGHFQRVKKVEYDCDEDTLLIQVEQVGVACHTGNPSCFYREFSSEIADATRSSLSSGATSGKAPEPYDPLILEKVLAVIQDRKEHPKKDSYVNTLLTSGQDRILKKIGEEAGELLIGSKNNNPSEIVYEMTDLWFHTLVLLGYHNIPLEEIYRELAKRFGTSGLQKK